jgi:flagellar hook-associated protein 1 FlgK
VTNGPGGTIAYDPATQSSGLNITLGGAFNGISFTVSGVPQNGDTFVITDNTGGVSDNRNALLMTDLQNQKTIEGNSTYLEGYTEVLGEVGSTTRRSEISRNAQETLLQQAETAREAKSGVNLDEEAADLVRYQQAYQAAAQIINTSNQLFQTLISAIAR